MSEFNKTGGPAFHTNGDYEGMTLLDYFAAKAMQGDMARGDGGSVVDSNDSYEAAAQIYYGMAEAMLLVDALRLERSMNPSETDLLRQRIAKLEQERDETYREYAELIRDLQEYFPGSTGMHAIYKSIEKMEAEREQFKHALGWLLNAPNRQDARDYALSLINGEGE